MNNHTLTDEEHYEVTTALCKLRDILFVSKEYLGLDIDDSSPCSVHSLLECALLECDKIAEKF